MDSNLVNIVLAVVQTLSLIALVVYVVKTWEMASATRKSTEVAEHSLQELRDSRDQETAPYVVVDFDVSSRRGLIELVVKNIGKSIARHVKVTFTPQLQASDESGTNQIREVGFIRNGMPALPPDHEVRTIVDGTVAYFGATGIPMSYDVTVSYFGGLSTAERTEHYTLDLTMYKNSAYTREAGMDDLTKAVKELADNQGKTRETLVRMSRRLDEGLWIRSLDSPMLPLETSSKAWKYSVCAKLREYALFCNSLLEKDANGEPTEKYPSDLQLRARMTSEQIVSLASRCPRQSPEEMEILVALASIIDQLNQIGRKTIYMDGGRSVASIKQLSDAVVGRIDQIAVLLTTEPIASAVEENCGEELPEEDVTLSRPRGFRDQGIEAKGLPGKAWLP